MQEILSIAFRGVVLICLFWRLGHTLKGLMKDEVPASELKWFGVDGFVLGLAGGVLTSAGVAQTMTWAVVGGLLFYGLASLGLHIKDDDPKSPSP